MAKRQRPHDARQAAQVGAGLSKSWTWTLVLAVVAGFAAFVLEPVWRPLVMPRRPVVEAVAEGERLYRLNCAPCHGPEAEGQVRSQPNGGQRADGTYIAPALDGTAHAWHHSPQQLFALIKEGSPAPDSPMKSWAGRLSDQEIESLLAYIQSLWPERLRERYRSLHSQS